MKDGGVRRDSALLFIVSFLLYLAFPSRLHLFDGVACAIAVELGDLRHLVHGNHLVYGVVGLLFHRSFGSAVGLDALWSLQVLDSLLGAASAAVLHGILRRAGFNRAVALLCGAGLAVSHAFWLWSVEANVYALGALFLLLTADEALRETPRPYALAFWHALAMLAHGANALLAPVAVLALVRRSPEPRRDVSRYLVSAALGVLVSYAAAIALWVRPADLEGLRLWLLGSAALGPYRTFLWQGQGPLGGKILDWLRTSGRLVCAVPWMGAPLWLCALAAPLLSRGRGLLVASGWLWLLAYAPMFLAWQPFNLIYRLTDAPALWLLAAPAIERLCAGRALRWAPPVFIAAVFAANLRLVIAPNSRPENNAALQEVRAVAAAVPENAWVAAEDTDQVYLPYFAHLHPLNLRWFRGREAALEARVRELQASGSPVYITDLTLKLGWQPLFDRLGLREAARTNRSILYRVSGP